MQDEVVAAVFPGPAFHLSNQKVAAAEVDFHLGADRIAAHVRLVDAVDLHLEPVICTSLVDKDFSVRHQVQVTIVIRVRPCGRAGNTQVAEPGGGGNVDKDPVSFVAIKDRAFVTDRTALDGGADPEVEIAVVVEIAAGRNPVFTNELWPEPQLHPKLPGLYIGFGARSARSQSGVAAALCHRTPYFAPTAGWACAPFFTPQFML